MLFHAFRCLHPKRAGALSRNVGALVPCVTSPHLETYRLEAKQLRVCLLSKRAEVLRQKSKVKVKSRSQRCARPQERGLGFALALAASRLASCPLAISTGFCFALAKSGPVCLQPQKKEAPPRI